jgi:hypothetical protein
VWTGTAVGAYGWLSNWTGTLAVSEGGVTGTGLK